MKRTSSEIEAEHLQTVTEAAVRLDALAAEHKATCGYLTSCAVAWEGQARRLRDYASLAHERMGRSALSVPPREDPLTQTPVQKIDVAAALAGI